MPIRYSGAQLQVYKAVSNQKTLNGPHFLSTSKINGSVDNNKTMALHVYYDIEVTSILYLSQQFLRVETEKNAMRENGWERIQWERYAFTFLYIGRF